MHDELHADLLDAFQRVYQANHFVLGKEVEAFEKDFAAFCGSRYAIGVANGLDALHVSLKTLGVGQGDEVIVPSNTFIATVLAVSQAGAIPVFAEPDPQTYNLTTDGIDRVKSSRTKAVIPVHLYGQSCVMKPMMTWANDHDVFVIEDNAQAQGATSNGGSTGSFGHMNATSFYPAKNIGALGDGGAIVCNDEELYTRGSVLRNYGSPEKYVHDVQGMNSRLDELQAAFLRVKLRKLPEWNEERQRIAGIYREGLSDLPDVVLPHVNPQVTHVYHCFVIQVPDRDRLRKYLQERGIGTLIHYPIPPHLQKAYAGLGWKKGDFPIAESLSEHLMSLPVYPGMTDRDISYVVENISDFFRS
ncbi:MAG: DegT/DnrJ/EryC1/StrS family aminotransferase [Flavobacteriales bacterium]|nr:DegT/DnrJ/EryC1/StrS family aminotransferase [Flavobacteriales bacterium]